MIYQKANDLADRLAEVKTVSASRFVAQRYFAVGRTDQALTMLVQYVNLAPSDANVWQNAFDMLRFYYQDSEVYHYYLEKIAGLLTEWNAEHMGTITLSEENLAFLHALDLA